MDNLRFGLLCAAGVICFFLWQAWQADYPAKPEATPAAQTRTTNNEPAAAGDDVPDLSSAPESPAQAGKKQAQNEGTGPAMTPAGEQTVLPSGKRIHVVTDKLDVSIDTRGGDLRRVELRGVPASDARPDADLRLLNDRPPNFFIAQSGLIGSGDMPDHRDRFTADQNEYRLREDQDSLEVPLHWQDDSGHRVTKIYTFHRGSYRVGLRHEIDNSSSSTLTVSQYLRFWRTPHSQGGEAPFARSFTGVAWYQQKGDSNDYRFEKIDFDDLADKPLSAEQTGGWLTMMQHYFLAAVIPPGDARVSYFAKPKDIPGATANGYAAGYVSAKQEIAAGGSGSISAQLFLGPKLQDQLAATGTPGLELTIDYGLLTVLAEPIFWVLAKLHAVVGNWGLAIILLTVLIKLAFYKLSETQYRAMARMRKFGPRIQQIKEQYGDDKEKLQAKMMDLYKKEGFNPLGGCWPMLVQMPVFISLYWVLRESAELRHAPFFLWINDLSSPDPYYILPVLFGISMFIQQRLSSSSMAMDPMQQRMMQVMPVALSVFFAFFPAGLVLYWLTNNLLSIAQQWYIYRKLDHEGLGNKAPAK